MKKTAQFPNAPALRRWMNGLMTLLLLNAGIVSAQAPKTTVEDPEFVEARRLFWSGQYDQAEKMFTTYLGTHANHEASRSFLQMIRQSRIFDRSKIDQTRKRLEEIKVDKVKFDQAEWRDVTEYLKNLANQKKDGKDPENYINFINLLPSGFSRKVTLDIQNVPLMKAIEYSCKMAGMRFVVDTWAVIIDLPPQTR